VPSARPHGVGLLGRLEVAVGLGERGADPLQDTVEVSRRRIPLLLQHLVAGRRLTFPRGHERLEEPLELVEGTVDLAHGGDDVALGAVEAAEVRTDLVVHESTHLCLRKKVT